MPEFQKMIFTGVLLSAQVSADENVSVGQHVATVAAEEGEHAKFCYHLVSLGCWNAFHSYGG